MAGYPVFKTDLCLIDVALGKTASQSSYSQWSSDRGASGVLGNDTSAPFGFHTDEEDAAWWEIDLHDEFPLEAIIVHNRRDCLWEKAKTISIETSTDKKTWISIHNGLSYFGPGNGSPPLQVSLNGKLRARYVRLELRERNYFHLSKVEILANANVARVIALRNRLNIALPISGDVSAIHPETYEFVASHPDLLQQDLIGVEINANGFFGNSVVQYANAIEFIIENNLKYLKVATGGLVDLPFPVERNGIKFLPATTRLPDEGAFLRGYFFHITPSSRRTVASRHDLIHNSVRMLYPSIRGESPRSTSQEVSIHIRSGDIFSNWVHPDYVQPPLSFYELVISRLMENFGVTHIHLVFEDRRNPVVDALENLLKSRGIPYRCQSGSLEDDISSLLNAKHMVYGSGTFGPAVCHFSDEIDTIHHFLPEGGHAFENTDNITRTFEVSDASGGYIRVGEWRNTPEQRRLMLEYPVDRLKIDLKNV